MTMKRCSECREWKPREEGFHRNRARPDGRSAQCRECRARYDRRYNRVRQNRVEDHAGTVKTNARSSAKKSARKKGIVFDLPESRELPDPPQSCPLCDRAMEPGGDSRNNSPSLDRILPQLGYVFENVWWICHDCNRQKSDLDPARAYDMWDRVWAEIKARQLPLPTTRLRPKEGRMK